MARRQKRRGSFGLGSEDHLDWATGALRDVRTILGDTTKVIQDGDCDEAFFTELPLLLDLVAVARVNMISAAGSIENAKSSYPNLYNAWVSHRDAVHDMLHFYDDHCAKSGGPPPPTYMNDYRGRRR